MRGGYGLGPPVTFLLNPLKFTLYARVQLSSLGTQKCPGREGSSRPSTDLREGQGWELGGGDGPDPRDRNISKGEKWEESLHVLLSRSRKESQEVALMLQGRQRGILGQVPAEGSRAADPKA